MTTSAAVREAARTYLVWAALTPLAGTLAFQMDGVFIGATWTATMRNMMILSTALYLAVWWLTREPLGNHGLWIALLTFLGARGVTLLWRCRTLATRTFDATLPPAAVRAAEPV
jgi:MATE family multidrug resistance protein